MSATVRGGRKIRGAALLSAVVAGVLAVLPGCAATPEATPTATASRAPETPTPTPDPYAGPLLFVGYELDAFALTPEEVAQLFPSAPPAAVVDDTLLQYSDGGGPEFSPAVCLLLIVETSMRSIGARTVPWVDEDDTGNSGKQEILQFASEEVAAARMDDLLSTVERCAQFDAQGAGTFAAVAAPETDGVRAFGGTLDMGSGDGAWRAHHAFAAVGNVIVHVWQPALDGSEFDAERAALLVRDRAREAKSALVEKLTESPPAPETPEAADPGAPWSEWEMTATGVGPLELGMPREDALAAIPGATAQATGGTHTLVRLVSADDTSTLLLHFTDDGTTLAAVTAGIANVQGDLEPDGAVLPATGGVRIGAPLSDAVAAFPEGTFLRVVSSAEFFYVWSTREGGTIRFRADRDYTDPAALITGVTVEDASLWPPLDFE
ncbi:sensor domain-containing protein [Microbacterium sp. K36]|uniref:sensor domain-containing protein n=1 Tax=Microbacterium sp. K36 TaxID=2305439 RepID=UPI00109CD801|nr:sensor domain-containing protein [Microbacterium sp. K36]